MSTPSTKDLYAALLTHLGVVGPSPVQTSRLLSIHKSRVRVVRLWTQDIVPDVFRLVVILFVLWSTK